MKKNILLIISLLSLFLSSCSKDDHNDTFVFDKDKKYLIVGSKAISVDEHINYYDAKELLLHPIGEKIYLGHRKTVEWEFRKGGRIKIEFDLYGIYNGIEMKAIIQNKKEEKNKICLVLITILIVLGMMRIMFNKLFSWPLLRYTLFIKNLLEYSCRFFLF